ncbi:MAG TPA: hypothetical protein VIJ02_08000 [Thermoanaerobaculia bacterium]
MRDDEIEEQDPEPSQDDPVTTMLDRLDSGDDLGAPGEVPSPGPARSRPELDRLVDQILDEELKRLNERKG